MEAAISILQNLIYVFELHNQVQKILGTLMGQLDYVQEACLEIVKSGQTLCEQLTSLNDHKSWMLLLRYCHVSCINHLAKTVLPSQLLSVAILHDQLSNI